MSQSVPNPNTSYCRGGSTGPSEEPAKILVRDDPLLIAARIRGLHTVNEVQDWLHFEVSNRSRQSVVALLNKRKSVLEEMGHYSREDLPWTDPADPDREKVRSHS